MQVYLEDISAWIIACAATLRQELQAKLAVLSSPSIVVAGHTALTAKRLLPGRTATRVSFFFFSFFFFFFFLVALFCWVFVFVCLFVCFRVFLWSLV